MSKITVINKTNIKDIRKDVAAALKAVEAKYGIQLSLGNMRYSDTNFRGKLEGDVVSPMALAKRKTIDWNKEARKPELDAKLLGKKFKTGGSEFTLVATKPRNRTYPFIGKGVRGGRYKFTEDQVANGFLG